MTDLSILIASLVLTAVLPISVAALYAMILGHTQLSASSAMDIATVQRFDSEAEREAFHADLQAAQEARAAAVMARYRRVMESELADIDPRRAAQFHHAIDSTQDQTAVAEPANADPDGCEVDIEVQATTPIAASRAAGPTLRQPRLALWRARQVAPRGNGPSA